MAKNTLEQPPKKLGKNENIKKRSTPSLTASQVYLAFVQTLNVVRKQTSQDQLAALQSMIQYIRNVGYWYALFSLCQKAELREVEDLKPERLDAEKIIALVIQYIGYLTSMISTPEEREDVSKTPPKLSASPARANERGGYNLMIEEIEEGITSCGEEVFNQFRETVETLEDPNNIFNIFGNIVEFSALITPMSITPIKYHDLYRRLKGVRFHTFLIALITLNDDNKNNQELQNGIAKIISSLSDSFMKTLRKNLKKCGHNDLPVVNRHQLLRLLAQEIQVEVLQRPPELKPEPEPITVPVGNLPETEVGGGEGGEEFIPYERSWTLPLLSLEEVNEILFPDRKITKKTTIFTLAITALAKNLIVAKYFRPTNGPALPKDRQLSVESLLDCLAANFGDDEQLLRTIGGAIYGAIKKGEITKREIIEQIMRDKDLLVRVEQFKELKRSKLSEQSELIKKHLPQTPQSNQNN